MLPQLRFCLAEHLLDVADEVVLALTLVARPQPPQLGDLQDDLVTVARALLRGFRR